MGMKLDLPRVLQQKSYSFEIHVILCCPWKELAYNAGIKSDSVYQVEKILTRFYGCANPEVCSNSNTFIMKKSSTFCLPEFQILKFIRVLYHIP